MEHILNLEQVKKYYGGNSGNITKAVDGISMYVDKGEFVAIMGASGSGKTTLLNCISTIDTVTSGHITVNNQDITKIKDKDFAEFRVHFSRFQPFRYFNDWRKHFFIIGYQQTEPY